MSHTIPGWSPDRERTFKEILFRFLEEVHCTKAALYLTTDTGRYALACQYGFGRRDLLATVHGPQEPLAAKARDLRTAAWAANHPDELPEAVEYLEGAGTGRLLLVPLYAESRLLGFVDARDKGRKRPFEETDLRRAEEIAGSLVEHVRGAGLYRHLGGPAVDATATAGAPLREPKPDEGALPFEPVELARWAAAATRLVVVDDVAAVVLTAATTDWAQVVVTVGTEQEGLSREAMLRHQEEALRAAGAPVPRSDAWSVEVRGVPGAGPGRNLAIASAVVAASEACALVVSVIGTAGSRSLAAVLELLADRVEDVRAGSLARSQRRRLARRLLEPGDRDYPELVAHSREVSRLTWSMATLLGLAPDVVEDAALAGLLHDVGMRELDYDRLYRHPSPGPEEKRVYQQHPVIGARILAATGVPRVVEAVRCHHERWDGTGYPDRRHGDGIPLLGRMVHLAETWDTLTSRSSYRDPVAPEQARAVIERGAEKQFDPKLIPVLFKVTG